MRAAGRVRTLGTARRRRWRRPRARPGVCTFPRPSKTPAADSCASEEARGAQGDARGAKGGTHELEGGGDGEGQEQRATIPSRLFIGGLDWRVTDDELKKKLEEYGLVTDVHIVKDRDTGDSRGFGFVTMANRKDADKAIKQLDGQEFSGRNLVVRQATERNR